MTRLESEELTASRGEFKKNRKKREWDQVLRVGPGQGFGNSLVIFYFREMFLSPQIHIGTYTDFYVYQEGVKCTNNFILNTYKKDCF